MRHARQVGFGQCAVVANRLQNNALVELAHARVVGAPHTPGIAHTGLGRGYGLGSVGIGFGYQIGHAQPRITPLQNKALP